jgi:hypothetical protein
MRHGAGSPCTQHGQHNRITFGCAVKIAPYVVDWPTLLLPEVELAEYPQEVMQRFHGTSEQLAAGLVAEPPKRWQPIVIEDYDPAWAARFAAASSQLEAVLGELTINIEHVGSTSVPAARQEPGPDPD